MSFLNLAKNRYTTKTYSDKKIDTNKIEELKEILRLSPSSINCQPWHFTFVGNPEVKEKLAKVSFFNEQKIREASHLVVFSVIDNLEKFEEIITNNLHPLAVDYYKNAIKSRGNEIAKYWLEKQVYISLGYFLTACASEGIDSTPMEGLIGSEYDKILNNNGYRTLFAVAIGYRNKEDGNQPYITPKSRLPLGDIISEI